MNAALINQTTNIVEDTIVADAAVDTAPAGYILVNLPDDSSVTIGWIYNPADGSLTAPASP